MSTNAMSSANQGPEIFSSCPHVRKYFRALIHRANARERVKPQASPAALRPIRFGRTAAYSFWLHYGLFVGCTAAIFIGCSTPYSPAILAVFIRSTVADLSATPADIFARPTAYVIQEENG